MKRNFSEKKEQKKGRKSVISETHIVKLVFVITGKDLE